MQADETAVVVVGLRFDAFVPRQTQHRAQRVRLLTCCFVTLSRPNVVHYEGFCREEFLALGEQNGVRLRM